MIPVSLQIVYLHIIKNIKGMFQLPHHIRLFRISDNADMSLPSLSPHLTAKIKDGFEQSLQCHFFPLETFLEEIGAHVGKGNLEARHDLVRLHIRSVNFFLVSDSCELSFFFFNEVNNFASAFLIFRIRLLRLLISL